MITPVTFSMEKSYIPNKFLLPPKEIVLCIKYVLIFLPVSLFLQVSIVNHLFSLAAASTDPALPLFSGAVITHAIQTVVDGFLEVSRYHLSVL